MDLQEQLVSWDNLRLAYQNAARGKRGFTRHQTRPPACHQYADLANVPCL